MRHFYDLAPREYKSVIRKTWYQYFRLFIEITSSHIMTSVQSYKMSLFTVTLFMLFVLAEILSGSAHMTPRQRHTSDIKAPGSYRRLQTKVKPAVTIILTTSTTAKVPTTTEPAVTIFSTTSTPAKVSTSEKPAIGIIRFTDITARALTTKEPAFGVIHYSQIQKRQCLNLNEKCVDSNLFCCKTQKLDNGEITDIGGFCYIFGGQCESRVNFPNYDSYVTIAKKLHKSTWERLNS